MNTSGHRFPKAIIIFAVYSKLKFVLSYREVEELLQMRGASIDHSTIQRWVFKFTPYIIHKVRSNKLQVGKRWRMDETYIKVKGQWRYLYRAVDKQGNTADFLLTKRRQRISAQSFLIKAIQWDGVPEIINIDKSGSKIHAIRVYNKRCYTSIEIRQRKYLNNIVEQDHRYIKWRLQRGFRFQGV
jgi:putative transposase